MKVAVIVMAGLLLLVSGCSSAVAVTSKVEKEQLVTRYITLSDVPKLNDDKYLDTDGVFPPDINPIKVNYGDELSTWTSESPQIGVRKGDPLSLYIFNRTEDEITYNISFSTNKEYDKDGNEMKPRDNDGNEYEILPDSIFWTELSDRIITIPPNTVGAVSVRIIIPNKTKDFELPEHWGFRLIVNPIQTGMVQRAYSQLWLISMR